MYRKDIFSHHNRIKPKSKSTFANRKAIKQKRITKDGELDYLNWLQTLKAPCMVCNNIVEHWHHVKRDSTDKKDHTKLIPLCAFHHIGDELSPHGTPKLWRNTYSIEIQNSLAGKYYEEYKNVQ